MTGVVLALMPLGATASAQEYKAQPAGNVPRIGHLSGFSPSLASATREAFLQGLNEVGYVEGRNILIEWRWAEGRFDRLPDLATELVQLTWLIGGGLPAGARGRETDQPRAWWPSDFRSPMGLGCSDDSSHGVGVPIQGP